MTLRGPTSRRDMGFEDAERGLARMASCPDDSPDAAVPAEDPRLRGAYTPTPSGSLQGTAPHGPGPSAEDVGRGRGSRAAIGPHSTAPMGGGALIRPPGPQASQPVRGSATREPQGSHTDLGTSPSTRWERPGPQWPPTQGWAVRELLEAWVPLWAGCWRGAAVRPAPHPGSCIEAQTCPELYPPSSRSSAGTCCLGAGPTRELLHVGGPQG